MRTVLHTLGTLLGRRWWWKTLIVLLAMAVMASLGMWQLDRLEQRRAYNAQLEQKLSVEPLVLGQEPLPASPEEVQDRQAIASGTYDYEYQILVKNQNYQGRPGVHLVTPLVLADGERALLVNRGWVPYREGAPERWSQFHEEARGPVQGYLERSRKLPDGSTTARTEAFQREWFRLDIEAIQEQTPYELLPVALELASGEEGRSTLPARVEQNFELDEGNHMSYALQWFTFAIIAGVVYVSLVRTQERERQAGQSRKTESSEEIPAEVDRQAPAV